MVDLLVSWVLSASALLLASRLFDSVKLKGNFVTALWVAALFALLSLFLNWLFFVLLGLVTLGVGFLFQFITRLVAAAIIVKVTAAISSRFDVRGFMPAVGTALLLALASELSARVLSTF